MLTRVQNVNTNFKAARVSILATADNHGNIMSLPRMIKTIENNAKEIFPKPADKSTLNVFAVVGDWFINPSKKGFITHPDMTNGELQNLALKKVIEYVQNICNTQGNGKSSPLEVVYTLGNHCLDAGSKFILNVMKNAPMASVITNVDLSKSDAVRKAMAECSNIVKSKEFSIPDDKNPNLLHKILFVSATIPSMDFYNPGLCEGIEFYDNSNKKDTNLNEANIQGTIGAIKNEVERFKSENPKGAVILLSHMGGRLSDIIQKNVPEIDHVLNGHDHKNTQTNVRNTSINSLGKDNEMIKSLNFEFSDEGNLVKSTTTPYFTNATLPDGLEKHPFQLFLNEFFEKDLVPLISLDEFKIETDTELMPIEQRIPNSINRVLLSIGIQDKQLAEQLMENDNFKSLIKTEADKLIKKEDSVKEGLNNLKYADEIRYRNSYLMNYLTTVIKHEVKKLYDPKITALAIQSSSIRGGIKDGADNLQVMKVFDGVSEDLSGLGIGDVRGDELVGLIVENVRENLKAPTRNTILHWSDIQVNRTMIDNILNNGLQEDLSKAIKVRNKLTKKFEPINLDETYRIVMGKKFLVKDDLVWPPKIRDRFKYIDKTYDELFRGYISGVNYKLHITPKAKEDRII